MKVVIAIQARLGSTRLPGKVLADVCGKPLLARMLERVALAQEPDAVVVATTWLEEDLPIVELCRELGVTCYRGHPTDCLERHAHLAQAHAADAIVKVPSDCPLIDPRAIDRVLARYRNDHSRFDYVSNLHPATWPDGNDVEVMSSAALVYAAQHATEAFEREHTTPYIWTRPDRFRLGNVRWELGVDYSQQCRWVVDWPSDLELVRRIFAAMLPLHGPGFSAIDVLELHEREPDLAQINAAHRGYSHTGGRTAALHAAQLRDLH